MPVRAEVGQVAEGLHEYGDIGERVKVANIPKM